ncbi:hypothetical protein JUNP479_0021 [Aeromonas jandaei]|uniref:DUF4209 domain-containing protein n=1 Tax=Aeromonas jandaei TaxID=650 RepID=UPI001951A97E|nr:DUF4209 domain-containing protein [Aeromonas jandaei]BCS47367.1 hypothetical protein JUNP479_0021 [Aeromonas jandaei]
MNNTFSNISVDSFVELCNEITIPPFEHGYYSLSDIYRNALVKAEEDKNGLADALSLIYEICSMTLSPSSTNDVFRPYLQLESKRSASVDDFSVEQLGFISEVYDKIHEPLLKARLADLLWYIGKPRNRKYVDDAIESYINIAINENTWSIYVKDCWSRAIGLAKQVRATSIISKIEGFLYEAFENDYPNASYMKLWLAETIIEHGLCEKQIGVIASVLFECAQSCLIAKEYIQSRQYCLLAEKASRYSNDKELLLKVLMVHAESYECEGDAKSSVQMVANIFYTDALQAYRRIPVKHREQLGVEEKVQAIRRKISESGAAALTEMGTFKSPKINISEIAKNAENHVKDKSNIERALIYFVGFSITNYSESREQALKQIKKYPLSNLFSSSYMSVDGRVIAKTPSFNFNGDDSEIVIHHKMIQNFKYAIPLHVKGCIIPALNQILSEYRITREFLIKVCAFSPIIPDGREELMASALWFGFEYDFSSCIYILAPQVENIVRVLFKSNGLNTSNIDRDGIETECGLSTLLNNPSAENILGKDILFELQAVFTESVGINLRNEVAHGLLSDQESNSQYCVYAWWMILRMIIKSLYHLK